MSLTAERPNAKPTPRPPRVINNMFDAITAIIKGQCDADQLYDTIDWGVVDSYWHAAVLGAETAAGRHDEFTAEYLRNFADRIDQELCRREAAELDALPS